MILPWFSVFDYLDYQMNGTEVTLTGQVTQPHLKAEAENAVKRIAGVTNVVDEIKVSPPSTFDDQIRLAEYRAIYGFPELARYRLGTMPSIRILVDNGHVTLAGFVDTLTDSEIANIRANEVPGVFSVTNDLRLTR